MTEEQFQKLAESGYNRIPIVREILADTETPLSIYLKLGKGPGNEAGAGEHSYFFESVQGGEKWGRYSIIGLPCSTVLRVVSETVTVEDNGKIVEEVVTKDPFEFITDFKNRFNVAELADGQRFNGGLVGYFSYDTVRFVETIIGPSTALDEVKNDPAKVTLYQQAIEKIKEYIVAGDVMQVVLSQRMSVPFSGEPLNLYRALRFLNPSPYMVYFNLGDHHVVSASPEILARVEDGKITVRPLAGTRKRGNNEAQDLALEKDLLADAKEIAEHLMLIDLSRNDSGRVSKTGSVTVPKQMFVERYSHVMHIASIVESEIRDDKTALDVLQTTLPVGTLSGAPKVRAMEIIDELEPEKRGIYGGAMGYLGWNDNMDMAIAIRTAVIKNEKLYVQAGAGIVADSQPEVEWEETQNKARAIVRAVQMANNELSVE